VGKFSWDERDPFEGLYRFRRPRARWPIVLAFVVAFITPWAMVRLLG
jgi:hypothetical protein